MAFSLNPLGRKIRDIFDANTAEDQRKRLTAGQPRYYQDQKAGQYYNFGTQSRTNVNPNQNPGTVNATYKNVDPSIRNTILTSKYLTQDQKINKLNSLNTPTKPFSATNALLSTWGDVGKRVVNAVTESPTQLGRSAAFGFSQDVKDAQQSANLAQEANLSNLQTARNALQNPYLTADQRQRYLNLYQKSLNNIGETNYAAQSLARERVSETDPRKVLAAAADTAFTAATAGVGTAGYKGLQTALKAGTKQGLKELAGQSTKLAGLAAPSGFAGTYVVNPDATLNEALKNTAITGIVGAALPIAGGAIGDVAAKGTRAAVKTASKINLSTPHVAALKEQNIALQKAFEKTSDIRTRTAAARQIALNNQEINRQRNILAEEKNMFSSGVGSEGAKLTQKDMPAIVADYKKRFGGGDFGETSARVELNKTGANKGNLGTYSFEKDMINLVEGKATKGAFNHESVHRAISKYLSDSEIEQLYKDAASIYGGKKSLKKEYRNAGYESATWRTAVEEEIANQFINFVDHGISLTKSGKAADVAFNVAVWAEKHNLPKSFVQVLKNLWVKLENRYTNKTAPARRNVEGFMSDLQGGKFANAIERTTKYQQPISPTVKFKNAALDKVIDVSAGRVSNSTYDKLLSSRYGSENVTKRMAVTTKSKKSNVAQSDAEYRAQQAAREKLYSQSPIQKARNATGNALWDPRNIEQRLDNAEFKRLKKAGKIKKGQSELLPDQSLAVQRGRIQNPNRAAEVRNKQKFGTGKDKYSINDIIKHYGKENSPKARDFENYRIYKDQLERLANGEKNTIGIDEKAMSTFVKGYEKSNPLAIKHNAALRQATLQALAEKNKMRIDNPELLKIAEKYKFYNPRKAIDPEDLVRPKMSGGVRSGAKTTKGRSETSGGPVRSPLSTFREMNTELERSLAEQRYGQEFRRRTAAGTIKGARETVNAETVIKHKKLLKDMESLRAQKDDLKRVRDQLKKDAKSGEQATYKTSVQAKKAEDRVVEMTRNLLEKARETGAKRPVYTRKQLLDLSKTLSDENLAAKVEKSAAQKAKLTSFEKNVEDLKSMLRQARDDIKSLDEASRKKWGETIQTVQRTERGTQEITYKLDGETGRIEIPPELAKSLDEQTKMMNRTIVERGLRGVANVQKLTWTGALQPAFKAWNVMVKNPILQFINADGLSGVRPETMSAFVRQVVNTKKMAQFKKDMLSRNMAYENALQSTNIFSTAADDIAARANIVTFFKRNPAKTLQDVWRGINQGLAAADNAQRYSVAYGAYKRAKGLGFSEKQALDIASQAPGKVFGDFDRVTRLAQDMEALVPYTGATQAGTRALGRAFKTKPITTGAKAAAVVGGMTALTAYSISNAKEYYKDMIDSGKEYVIDNNWVIAMPGASRDKDGNWSGIISVPMLPDIRPTNRATWKTVYDQTEGKGIDGKMVASEMFNQMTGDVSNQLYDVERTDNRKNLVNGVLPGSPIVNVSKTLSGVNTFTGNPLADEFTASRPRVEQKNKNTSPGAEKISKSINGVLTPLQVDQLLGQIGTTGDVVQGKDDTRGTIVQSFTKPLQPGKGLSDKSRSGKQYYEAVDSAGQTIKNADDFRVFQSLTSKNSEKTAFDSAARAKELLARPSVLQALAQVNKDTGSKDPFYNLTNQQQQKVLLYRSSKDLNSAKQAYDKDGNPLFTSLGLDEKWYSDYKDKEDAFYKSVSGGESGTITTFSGAVKPKASDELQALIDAYYTIPKGTGARSSYLKQHPEILAYWDKSNQFTNAERIALGLDVNTTDSTGSGSYGSGGSSGSSFANARKYAISLNAGGTPSSSSGVKASQVKWKGSSASVNKPKVTIKKSKV